MRYQETGNVHKDFHLAMNTSIEYVLGRYGIEFLRELFRRTAQSVYRDIYDSLAKGNWKPLLEHWRYFYDREGGEYEVTYVKDGFVFTVTDCPAARHLREKKVAVTDHFRLQDVLLNEGWSLGTPFNIKTELLSEKSYRMSVILRNKESELAG